ncbi:hypothetical protein, unlikely [Trypanosoma brucei gambiense DAL972]|uniref:Uncharacterized protein n=1 Tax=Trypanosoma brucei gambiense (strain MHOM/CI/86/DAL972) TaxID=679716 RepID=C9ZRK8_TRYB9|nr:hypothetical protein, unlikely [Trypanosoma brucei gambiense DAL972]CBH12310.1 hypothetical protein, unlikely [Trypanosoma brucei gambiense DAL972]|eukprot:XP_011774591.1 hypothetical protein, unlikely [Trypanosoma brucei gambiense DAL972]
MRGMDAIHHFHLLNIFPLQNCLSLPPSFPPVEFLYLLFKNYFSSFPLSVFPPLPPLCIHLYVYVCDICLIYIYIYIVFHIIFLINNIKVTNHNQYYYYYYRSVTLHLLPPPNKAIKIKKKHAISHSSFLQSTHQKTKTKKKKERRIITTR